MKKAKNLTRRKSSRIQKPKTERSKIENQIAAVATVNPDQVSETFRIRNVATIINPPQAFETIFTRPIHIPYLPGVTRQMIIDGIRERMTELCDWHSPECHYFGQNDNCLACMGY